MKLLMLLMLILLININIIVNSYKHQHQHIRRILKSKQQQQQQQLFYCNSDNNDFDAGDFEKALKSMGPVWNTANKDDKAIIDGLREEQEALENDKEQIFRKYPFEDQIKLPILPDCNNYYSGKFGNYIWHQNSDQVYVFIPVSNDITKNDIDVKFEAKKVTVSIGKEDPIGFDVLERIIPDGSFWVFEEDKNDNTKKYLMLDLEKRLRMINWKNLFGPPQPLKSTGEQNELLQKLFQANKGMAKIMGDGASPESIKDMLQDDNLMRSISSEPNLNPVIDITDDIINKMNNEDDNEK